MPLTRIEMQAAVRGGRMAKIKRRDFGYEWPIKHRTQP